MLMNVLSCLRVTQVPHAPTHLELTCVLAMKAIPEMEQLALVGKINCHNYLQHLLYECFGAFLNCITQMLMNVWSSLLVIRMPLAPTHLGLTPVAVMKATLEMEQLAVVSRIR